MNEVIPFTINEMRSAPGKERGIMLDRYADWRERQRCNDRLFSEKRKQKIYRFKNKLRKLNIYTFFSDGVYGCFQYSVVAKKNGELGEYFGFCGYKNDR